MRTRRNVGTIWPGKTTEYPEKGGRIELNALSALRRTYWKEKHDISTSENLKPQGKIASESSTPFTTTAKPSAIKLSPNSSFIGGKVRSYEKRTLTVLNCVKSWLILTIEVDDSTQTRCDDGCENKKHFETHLSWSSWMQCCFDEMIPRNGCRISRAW